MNRDVLIRLPHGRFLTVRDILVESAVILIKQGIICLVVELFLIQPDFFGFVYFLIIYFYKCVNFNLHCYLHCDLYRCALSYIKKTQHQNNKQKQTKTTKNKKKSF